MARVPNPEHIPRGFKLGACGYIALKYSPKTRVLKAAFLRGESSCIYAVYVYSDVDPGFVDYALKADSTKPMNDLSRDHPAKKEEWYRFNNGSWSIYTKD